jgi:methyl-accepting chemotaxis protein-1 (serine sensor receptor)
MLLMLFAAGLGLWKLSATSTSGRVQAQTVLAQTEMLGDMEIEFKTQVQEWKNVLLRGKDSAALDKHWNAFSKNEQAVQKKANELHGSVTDGPTRDTLQQFITAHTKMGQDYRKGLDAFKAADHDAAAGDVAVKGIDREPIKLLAQVKDQVIAVNQAETAVFAQEERNALFLCAGGLLAAAGTGLFVAWRISRNITRVLGAEPDALAQAARRVAEGDLSETAGARVEPRSVMAAMEDMRLALVAVVGTVRSGVESVATASAQIAQGNSDLSSRTEEQASSLEQTAASMEQLTGTVNSSVDNARQANHLATSASEVAGRGGDVVNQVVTTMNDIQASSRKISDIIGVIDGIAFQTNILALNAAVEAARAGEQGRGFAVVASEVRSLAQRSAQAAKEIKTLIADSVEKVNSGSSLVNEAGQTMTDIVDQVKHVTTLIAEITTASSEQSSGIGQVNQAVSQLDQMTQQNAALVEESAAAAESLRNQAEQLAQAVSLFKLP